MPPAVEAAEVAELRLVVVVSRYHAAVAAGLEHGARTAFAEAGGDPSRLEVIEAAGAFELTPICRAVAELERVDAIVALGCVITGETAHDRYLTEGLVQGLTAIMVRTGVPIAFGVLTCATMEQAAARAGGGHGGGGNKGAEAMEAALRTAITIRRRQAPRPVESRR